MKETESPKKGALVGFLALVREIEIFGTDIPNLMGDGYILGELGLCTLTNQT